jgi:limonene 1,2-monooxygenase
MEESLEAILLLLTSVEPVNIETDWFTLKDARLQLRPYTHPHFEIAVAAQVSPSGPRLAGRFGLNLLSIGATSRGGFDVLGSHWSVMEERAEEFGTTVERQKWRLVGPMHIAETEEQAREDVAFGLPQWMDYFQRVAALPLAPEDADTPDKMVDAMNNSGMSVIGTPEQAIGQVQRLIDQSGGFGTFLFMAHEWADREATLRSYELFAREVIPHFQGQTERAVGSRDWAANNRPQFIGAATTAVIKAITDHQAEKAAKAEAKA